MSAASDFEVPEWLPPEGRPHRVMVEKGVFDDVIVAWLPGTLRIVPRLDELVLASDDQIIAGDLACRFAVLRDKFMTGGDVRDSSEARQLMRELQAMAHVRRELEVSVQASTDHRDHMLDDLGV